jgi:hypothetical protein
LDQAGRGVGVQVAPGPAVGQVEQGRREAVAAEVAHPPGSQTAVRAEALERAQPLVEGEAEGGAAGVPRAVGADEEVAVVGGLPEGGVAPEVVRPPDERLR